MDVINQCLRSALSAGGTPIDVRAKNQQHIVDLDRQLQTA